jgi:hypothetical protein
LALDITTLERNIVIAFSGVSYATHFRFSDIMGSEAILVLGSQFGDEGKGKLIDIIAAERDIWYVEVISRGGSQSFSSC